MNILETDRALVRDALWRLKLSKRDFAAAIGRGPAWFTKFNNGTIKTLAPELRERIEDVLGIRFRNITRHRPELPAWLVEFEDASKKYPELQTIALALLDMTHQAEQHRTRAAEPPHRYQTRQD